MSSLHESLERAVGVLQAREAACQDAAGQEVSELLFYELRQWWSVGVTLGSFEKASRCASITRYSTACPASRGR